MFNIGPAEIVLISVVALLVFGPKRLPELARGMGRGIRDFKKALEGGGHDEAKALPEATDNEQTIDVAPKVSKGKKKLTTVKKEEPATT